MDYVARLLEDKTYQGLLRELENLEAGRIYCRHGFEHLMDVARLCWITVLENKIDISKEEVYLAALLHDIGRVEEYQTGISHAAAGRRLAREILLHIGYPEEKTEELLAAISGHRGQTDGCRQGTSEAGRTEPKEQGRQLAALLKRADKASRPCFRCLAADTCKWTEERRNTPENWE